MNIEYIVIFALLLIVIFLYMNKKDDKCEHFVQNKPYLWQYWDTLEGKTMPVYIEICLDTVTKHCESSFNIIRLSSQNIYDYIPEVKKYSNYLDKLAIAHKVDIYRLFLLHKYGGLYLDADIICLRDPIEIIGKLNDYDFVGFGCTGNVCKNGYGKPSNWILASRQNGILMGRCKNAVINKIVNDEKIDYKDNYHDLGKMIIWSEIEKLQKESNYIYYQYPNTIDGSRDINGHWINTDIVFSNIPVVYDDEKNMMFYVFYNSGISDNIKKMNKTELLNSNYNYSKFAKRALGYKN